MSTLALDAARSAGAESPAEAMAEAVAAMERLARGGPPQWPDWHDDESIARDAGLPVADFLRLLARYPSVAAARRVARSENAPADALHLVSAYPDVEVLQSVSANPNVSEDTLQLLAGHPATCVRSSVAEAHQVCLPEHLQESLAKDTDVIVRANVARRADAREDLLSLLAHDPDVYVVRAAIGNPRLPLLTAEGLLDKAMSAAQAPEWLPDLLDAGPRYDSAAFIERIADAAAAHPEAWISILGSAHTPVALLEAAAKRRSRLSAEAAAALAENANLPPASLSRLGKDRRVSVQLAVLANPNVPCEIVDALSAAEHDEIAALALGHPKCPVERLVPALTGRRRVGAAGNPLTPGDVLSGWVRDVRASSGNYWTFAHLLQALISNPSLPRQAWELLATPGRAQDDVRRTPWSAAANACVAALRSPLCPPDLLVQACMAADYSIRHAAAGNPACPDEGRAAAALMPRR